MAKKKVLKVDLLRAASALYSAIDKINAERPLEPDENVLRWALSELLGAFGDARDELREAAAEGIRGYAQSAIDKAIHSAVDQRFKNINFILPAIRNIGQRNWFQALNEIEAGLGEHAMVRHELDRARDVLSKSKD